MQKNVLLTISLYKQSVLIVYLLIPLFLLSLVLVPNLARAELCESYSEDLTGQSGSVKLSGDICLVDNTYSGKVTGTINVSYSEYSADGSFSVDGQLILTYLSDSVSPAASTLSVTYNGGPVTYTIAGQSYDVEFQNLSYSFDGQMQQTAESGNILLNGVELDAKDTPYTYVKLF